MSRILVTGATRGLGRALVNELSRRGHEVVATGRRLEDMADLPAAERLVLDLTNPASIDQALAAAGRLEVVINNAAMTVSGPVEAVPATLVEQVLATNVLGPLRVMQAALPTMRRRGSGRTLNISSPAGRFAPLEGCIRPRRPPWKCSASAASPSGGNSAYLIGRNPGSLASSNAGRISFTNTGPASQQHREVAG
jgi:NAD(P)-dependent dehydrogenase (short-subunit alcohol dehydrogenase family)